MVHYVEIMRESLLRRVRRFNSTNSFAAKFYHPDYKQYLLDFINDFMVYVSPQGEEIRTLEEVLAKEARGEYEEAPACYRIYNGDFYAVSHDNPDHPLYWGEEYFRRQAPEFQPERDEAPESIDCTGTVWKPDTQKIVDFVERRHEKKLAEAKARLERYEQDPELKGKRGGAAFAAALYVEAEREMNCDMHRMMDLLQEERCA